MTTTYNRTVALPQVLHPLEPLTEAEVATAVAIARSSPSVSSIAIRR